MKNIIRLLISITVLLFALASCGNDDGPYVPCNVPADFSIDRNSPIWLRHHDSCLKILAVGNSFTVNATNYIPGFLNYLNNDSICFARLVRSGCSLSMHWKSHIEMASDYELHYSDNGNWNISDIQSIDRALMLFDWDIIVIQQVSGLSGIYSSYQPALDYLVRLFRETNPSVSLAWHYTWAYTPWTNHTDFKNYNRNSDKMYYAIIDAGNKASENFEIGIPSATLIKRMREEFPEVENGFSDDGSHITDTFAQFALASLWYETLVRPFASTSIIESDISLPSVEKESVDKVNEIIRSLSLSSEI